MGNGGGCGVGVVGGLRVHTGLGVGWYTDHPCFEHHGQNNKK